MSRDRRRTATSAFGVSRRESHDASDFYSRFGSPVLSSDSEIVTATETDRIFCHDARSMPQIPDKSVALVVTSPPYFAGKEYEAFVEDGLVPSSYIEYLEMLRDVFSECARKLEPGGRIAVNVANLGRKPYRSLSADVIRILEEDLGLLLRGEIIWQKGSGASGNCAWGSFQNSSNPVIRDLTERIVIASKGRFDRAIARRERAKRDLPSEVTIFKDDFMEATTDIWEIPPESANRVGHPAPFPIELPQRLIQLYTYRGDLVVDPFMGSGTTAVAALRTDRHFVCYDTDPDYVQAALKRVSAERKRKEAGEQGRLRVNAVAIPAFPIQGDETDSFQARAVRQGQKAKEIARAVLTDCGFTDIVEGHRFKTGVEVNFIAKDLKGKTWFFDVSGAFSSTRAGLRRTDTIWKALGRASLLSIGGGPTRLILLTTDLPPKGSAGHTALKSARGHLFLDAVEMLSDKGQDRLRAYCKGEAVKPIDELLSPENAPD